MKFDTGRSLRLFKRISSISTLRVPPADSKKAMLRELYSSPLWDLALSSHILYDGQGGSAEHAA